MEIRWNGNVIGIWISAGCSVLTLGIVLWHFHFLTPDSRTAVFPVDPPHPVSSAKASGSLPSAGGHQQGSEDARIWIEQIERVMKSGKSFKVDRKAGIGPMRNVLGSNIPVEKVEWTEIRADGSFSVKFDQEHFFDYPLAVSKGKNKYARIQVKKGLLTGKLLDGKTWKGGLPVKMLVFKKPQLLSVDPLDHNRESTVPGFAKILGVLPNIVALICYKGGKIWLMAPQLNGRGESENPGLIKDLIKIDDAIDPKLYSKL